MKFPLTTPKVCNEWGVYVCVCRFLLVFMGCGQATACGSCACLRSSLPPCAERDAGRGAERAAAGRALGAGEPEGAGRPRRCSAPGVSCELPPRRQGRRQAGSEPARQTAPR